MKRALYAVVGFLLAAVAIYILAPGWIVKTMSDVAAFAGSFRNEYLEKDGLEFHYLDNHRPGKPVLVMLHGYSDRKESWLPFANRFSRDFRVILPDARGHGANGPDTAASFDFASQAEYIRRFTESLGFDDFHLVGISMGGGIAGEYAAHFPETLRSLTFISTAGIENCPQESKMDRLMEGYGTLEEKKANFPLLPSAYTRASARLFKDYVFYKDIFAPNRLFREYTRQVIENREYYLDVLDDFVDIATGDFKDPLDEELGRITCPVLVIWGREDPLLDVSCVETMTSQLPEDHRVDIIEKCGHATIVEQPRATYLAMRDFLQEVIR